MKKPNKENRDVNGLYPFLPDGEAQTHREATERIINMNPMIDMDDGQWNDFDAGMDQEENEY